MMPGNSNLMPVMTQPARNSDPGNFEQVATERYNSIIKHFKDHHHDYRTEQPKPAIPVYDIMGKQKKVFF